MRYLLPLAVFCVVLIFLAVGLTLDPREVPSPLIGKPAPAFSLPQLVEAQSTLSQTDLQGEVSVLNVWASWCVSCRQEHPLLMRLARQQILPIYGLNYKDERQQALEWLARFGNPYRASGFDSDGRVGIDWGVYGVPETFVIDKRGRIRYKHTGPLTDSVITDKLMPLILTLQGEPS